jgi:hypothetical protein
MDNQWVEQSLEIPLVFIVISGQFLEAFKNARRKKITANRATNWGVPEKVCFIIIYLEAKFCHNT